MGHCLGLHHTFFGEPSVGQPPCDEVRDCDRTIIASSDTTRNDGISDTNRDPKASTDDCVTLIRMEIAETGVMIMTILL